MQPSWLKSKWPRSDENEACGVVATELCAWLHHRDLAYSPVCVRVPAAERETTKDGPWSWRARRGQCRPVLEFTIKQWATPSPPSRVYVSVLDSTVDPIDISVPFTAAQRQYLSALCDASALGDQAKWQSSPAPVMATSTRYWGNESQTSEAETVEAHSEDEENQGEEEEKQEDDG